MFDCLSQIEIVFVYGQIPNYKWVKSSTYGAHTLGSTDDHTEPPIGGYTLYKLYEYYSIKNNINFNWILEYLFDDLYDWITWFWNNRRCEPYKLICLGSTPPYIPMKNWERVYNNKHAAADESGLDNSPMWDNATFDNVTTHLMQLYDVGMNSMEINEIKYLIKIAKIIGKSNSIIH